MSIFQISVRATEVPAMGVHKPAISRNPAPIKNMAGMVTLMGGGSLHSVMPARTTSAEPATTRIRSNPVPGQPPANVEYRRRKDAPFRTTLPVSAFSKCVGSPQRVRSSLFRVLGFGRGRDLAGHYTGNYSSMMPLFSPIMAACVRSLAPNFERMFLTRPLTVSSGIES